MESQHFGHEHPLAFNEKQSNQSEQAANCSRCGEVASGPSFSCVECGFYLHKNCAEAPLEINHPFHDKHPLVLMPTPPPSYTTCICDFCDKTCKMFVYHCSCGLDFHIKCALFSCDIAEKKFGKLEHIAHPWISTDEQNEELDSAMCFGCWNPLLGSTYYSLDCGFNLHKKCGELSPEINHFFHQQHPLVLQFNGERFFCNMCQKQQRHGFVYCCSPCKFALHIKCSELLSEINHLSHRKHPLVFQFNSENLPCKACPETSGNFVYCCSSCKFALHIECVSSPPSIKKKSHQHPFTFFYRPVSFICDACGLEGDVAYICSVCSLIVHKKCIFLPRIIKAVLHDHPISHTYFLYQHDFESWDCRICHDNVNTEYGSYCCLGCKFIVHVNCIIMREAWYYVVESEEKYEKPLLLTDVAVDSITCVIERDEGGEATKIKHFSHDHHDLVLSKMISKVYKCCDGCMLPISTSFYSCSQCDFFLHKTCAELPRKTTLWYHLCQNVVTLIANNVYECRICAYVRSGFSYNCEKCKESFCLSCSTPDTLICDGHEHTLLYYCDYQGSCSACGEHLTQGYCCKRCNFALHDRCVTLPQAIWHKCDEHLLTLTYYDSNDYSEYHYCDICEETRNPKHWFYRCIVCNTFIHLECALGRYAFIKLGSIYQVGDHQHPLKFVKKIYHYPECHKCAELCQDLALECVESGCNFIVHWGCIKPSNLN